jgi:hypothetical protein
MELIPSESQPTTITLTRAKPAELASPDAALYTLALVLGVVGILALVTIVYLMRR